VKFREVVVCTMMLDALRIATNARPAVQNTHGIRIGTCLEAQCANPGGLKLRRRLQQRRFTSITHETRVARGKALLLCVYL